MVEATIDQRQRDLAEGPVQRTSVFEQFEAFHRIMVETVLAETYPAR